MTLRKLAYSCLNTYYIIHFDNMEVVYRRSDIPLGLLKRTVSNWWVGMKGGYTYINIRLEGNENDD